MGYYTIRLTPQAQKLCTIVFPWGNTPIYDCPWELLNHQIFFKAKYPNWNSISYNINKNAWIRQHPIKQILITSINTINESIAEKYPSQLNPPFSLQCLLGQYISAN
jgi:hypothetical protein